MGKRGVTKEKVQKPNQPRQDLIKQKLIFDGEINRSYLRYPKYAISPVGEKAFEIYTPKSEVQLQKKYPGAIIKPIVKQ